MQTIGHSGFAQGTGASFSSLNQSVNWHHMKDNIEIGHLSKFEKRERVKEKQRFRASDWHLVGKGRWGRGVGGGGSLRLIERNWFLSFRSSSRPIRITQCCTEFKSFGNKRFDRSLSISFKCECYIIMQLQHTKNLNPERFKLDTTLS